MSELILCTKELLATAFNDRQPQLESLMRSEEGIRGTFAVLPSCLVEPKYALYPEVLSELVEAIGFYLDLGGSTPERPFDANAMGKLFALYYYQAQGYSSRYVAAHPWLLRTGMSKWPGGINDEGILVAYSGQSPETDEDISRILSSRIKALSRERFGAAFDELPGVLRMPLTLAS